MNGDGTVYARRLRKCFGNRVVLDSIDLDVACGEICCIIGPAARANPPLLRCINGLERSTAGSCRSTARTSASSRPTTPTTPCGRKEVAEQRTRIGMVFQQFNLFPNMTARENVMSGPVLVKGADEEGRRGAGGRTARQRRPGRAR